MTGPPLSETNVTIKRALALASANPQQALSLLEERLTKSRASGDRESVHSLARNAGIVCAAGLGDPRRAIAYYEEAVSAAPEDASLHLARGDLHRQLGEHDAAATAFARSLEQATEQGDLEMIDMASKAQAGLDDGERGN